MKYSFSYLGNYWIEKSKIKLLLVSCIILLIPISLFSQTHLIQTTNMFYMPAGNVIESLGNIGGKSTNSIISEIGASNPASISDFSNRLVGISYQFDTKINEAWISGFGHSRIMNYLPQSIGIVIPKENWRFGISMNQIYNTEINYGEIVGTIVWNNDDGYLDINELEPERREQVLKNSFTVAYKIENVFESNNSLIFGFQSNFTYIRFEQSLSGIDKIDESFYAINFVPGIIFEFWDYNKMKSKIGFYFESKIEQEEEFKFNSNPVRLISKFPHKLNFGIYHPCGEHWRYAANISYGFWNDINTNYKNQIELSAAAGYLFSKTFKFNFGFFSTDKKYKNKDSIFDLNNLMAIYLILSANYKIENVSFDFTFADSHLMSDDWRKQTVLKIGTGYEF